MRRREEREMVAERERGDVCVGGGGVRERERERERATASESERTEYIITLTTSEQAAQTFSNHPLPPTPLSVRLCACLHPPPLTPPSKSPLARRHSIFNEDSFPAFKEGR